MSYVSYLVSHVSYLKSHISNLIYCLQISLDMTDVFDVRRKRCTHLTSHISHLTTHNSISQPTSCHNYSETKKQPVAISIRIVTKGKRTMIPGSYLIKCMHFRGNSLEFYDTRRLPPLPGSLSIKYTLMFIGVLSVFGTDKVGKGLGLAVVVVGTVTVGVCEMECVSD